MSKNISVTYAAFEYEILKHLVKGLGLLLLVQPILLPKLAPEIATQALLLAHLIMALPIIGIIILINKQAIPLKWTLPLYLVIFGSPIIAALPSVVNPQSMLFDYYTMFTLSAAGGVMISARWFNTFSALAVLTWGTSHFFFAPQGLVLTDALPILASLIIGSTLMFSRQSTRRRLEQIHIQGGVWRTGESFNNELFSAMEQSETAVLIISQAGLVEYANQGFKKMTGLDTTEVLGQCPKSMIVESSQWLVIKEELATGRRWQGDIHCCHTDGHTFWARASLTPICDDNGQVIRYSCVAEDVTRLREIHKEMERMAFFDTLTGLHNRRLLMDRLEQAMNTGIRSGNLQALLYLDLDRFKDVNDTYGHDVGDALLIATANRLKQIVRAEDTVARLGGDEFIVLLHAVENSDAACLVASKILHEITQPVQTNGQQLVVSTSIGIAIAPTDSQCPTELLKHADMAMYQAKAKGRNRYHFYTSELNTCDGKKEHLIKDLRRAIEEDELELYFQPWINMKTQEVSGSEALLRWNHPNVGQLKPNEFMDIAEKSNLSVPLGRWVLWRTGEYLADLKRLGVLNKPVSINISKRQLLDPELTDTVADMLKHFQLEPRDIELEVSEVVLSQHGIQAIDTLKKLHQMGVRIALDNYGTGSVSPSELAELGVSVVKVDQSYIQQMARDQGCRDVASAVIAMAHKLHMEVVAGGVETQDQKEILTYNNCDFAQGYLFFKPLDSQSLTNLYVSEISGEAN